VYDSMEVAACRRRAVCAFCRRGGGGRGAGRGVGVGAACRVARLARCRLRSACHWFIMVAWRRRTWSWTWCRGWCSLSSGTARTLPLAFRVPLVLNGGVAAAYVELDVVEGVVLLVEWDGVQVAACARRAAGTFCRSDGGRRCCGRRAGRGGGGGAACHAGRRARWRLRGASTLCFLFV